MASRKSNVLVVVIDALRRDRVGAYSDRDSLTPNIDSIATAGTVFDNAFSATNATDPSITSIHTGREPKSVVTHHGPYVTDDEKRRAEAANSVPEILQSAGIRTVAAGRPLARWHSDGFDEYPEEALDVRRRRSIGQQLERISPKLRSAAGAVYEKIAALKQSVDESDEIDDFLDALDDDPFYGFVHMMDPHMPCDPETELIEEMLETRSYPNRDLREFFDSYEKSPYISEFLADVATDADFEVGLARLFARYDAAVIEADRKVGRLIEGLEARNLLEETTIIVTSDHGESLDEHDIYFDHHGLYDPSVRVPMIVSGPEVPAGRREEYVRLPDIAPTVLDILDIDGTVSASGRSLTPLLGGSGTWTDREFVVFQEAQAQSRIGIRTDQYKFIKHVSDPVLADERGSSFECGYCKTVHAGERELYDLSTDPGETRNIVDERPEIATELEETLDTYFAELEPVTVQGENGAVTYEDEDAVMERLEDLGYK